MSLLKADSVVLCEEVRREASGSAIIVGARPSGPAVKSEDVTIIPRLGVYVELSVSFPPPTNVAIRLWSEARDYLVFQHDFEMPPYLGEGIPSDATDIKGGVLLAINEEGVEISGPGEYLVQAKADNEEWDTLRSYVFPELEVEETS